MKTSIYLSFLAALIGLSIGCTHKSSSGMSAQDYPIAVGNKWTYQLTDDLYSYTDTQTITVISKNVYNNDSTVYHTQTISHDIIIDSSAISFSANSYIYSNGNANYALFYGLKLAFPIAQGSHWIGGGGGYYSDSMEVLYAGQTETVLNNTYSNVYEIKRQQIGLDNTVLGQIHVAPKIGVVYQTMNINLGYPVKNQTIRLISYELHLYT